MIEFRAVVTASIILFVISHFQACNFLFQSSELVKHYQSHSHTVLGAVEIREQVSAIQEVLRTVWPSYGNANVQRQSSLRKPI